MTGFDSLVDELMACHGYDRDEAELIAEAKLAAGGDNVGRTRDGESWWSATPVAATPVVKPPAASFACDPCECGGLCDECQEAE